MNDCPGATRSRFVPSRSICASRSAFEDSEIPSTATIDATPIAIPSADSAARARRVRSPSAPVRSTSAAVIRSSPSRSSTRRGKASAIAWSWVITTIVEPASCRACSSARMSAPVRLSRLPVGSSANRIDGRPTSARAIATRWRSPPESFEGECVSRCSSPTEHSASRACARRSDCATPV